MTTDAIQQVARLLHESRYPVVLTGAGASRESGIPTFRDALDGLWARYDPMELATAEAFRRDPKLVWDFYEFRRALMRPARPNAGHEALAALERWFPDLPIITQNIDDLHEQAGSRRVIHLHGSIARNKCFFNCQGEPTPVDVAALAWERDSGPPACPFCGRWVRPDVVWFGERLPEAALTAAYAALERADLALVVGTSGVVSPAAEMPLIARSHGARIVEVNPNRSGITTIVDVWLEQPAGEALPEVMRRLDALRA